MLSSNTSQCIFAVQVAAPIMMFCCSCFVVNMVNLTGFNIFIAPQHAVHAEVRYCFTIPSVCLSSAGTVSKRMHISSLFIDILVRASFCFFLAPVPLQNAKGNPLSQGGIKYKAGGKI